VGDRLWGWCSICWCANVLSPSSWESIHLGDSCRSSRILSLSWQENLLHGQYLRSQYEDQAFYGFLRKDASPQAWCLYYEWSWTYLSCTQEFSWSRDSSLCASKQYQLGTSRILEKHGDHSNYPLSWTLSQRSPWNPWDVSWYRDWVFCSWGYLYGIFWTMPSLELFFSSRSESRNLFS